MDKLYLYFINLTSLPVAYLRAEYQITTGFLAYDLAVQNQEDRDAYKPGRKSKG